MSLKSLAIIPNTKCKRGCSYCYENYKNYGKELSEDSFLSLIKTKINEYDPEEILIDFNVITNIEWLERIVHSIFPWMNILITTTVDQAELFMKVYKSWNVKYVISIHTESDLEWVNSISTEDKKRVECLSLMYSKDDLISKSLNLGFDIYLLHDKFDASWKNGRPYTSYLEVIKKYSAFENLIEVDHCVSTLINNQSCPAFSQVNIYRDGSIRRCPYSPVDQSKLDSSTFDNGCQLIKEVA